MDHLISLTDRQSATLMQAINKTDYTLNDIVMLGASLVFKREVEPEGVGAFINENCEHGANCSIPVAQFKARINETSGRNKYYSQKEIAKYMRINNIISIRPTISGRQVRSWKGLRWRTKI